MPPRTLFADAFYWVALLYPRDASHARVTSYSKALGSTRLVTTDEVLTEILNWFSAYGPVWRAKAAGLIHNLRNDPTVEVLPQTRVDFDAALALYASRPDKGYSLTDCRSMLAMRGHGITDALTNDRHFGQEGFTVIFQAP
jgi:predicted nucleic acid-binding protein